MTERYIVIGDIHGCPRQLEEILEKAGQYRGYRYVFLGDYIDRGPDSEAVIRMIRSLDAVFLLGNHDAMFVEQARRSGGSFRGDPFLRTLLSEESAVWLRDTPVPILETGSYIFVHAGFDRSKDLAGQTVRDYLWSRERGDYYGLTDKTVIHGHTIVPVPEIVGNRININTGCGLQGPLTALVLPEMEFIRSSEAPGISHDWAELARDLKEELWRFDELGELEEIE